MTLENRKTENRKQKKTKDNLTQRTPKEDTERRGEGERKVSGRNGKMPTQQSERGFLFYILSTIYLIPETTFRVKQYSHCEIISSFCLVNKAKGIE